MSATRGEDLGQDPSAGVGQLDAGDGPTDCRPGATEVAEGCQLAEQIAHTLRGDQDLAGQRGLAGAGLAVELNQDAEVVGGQAGPRTSRERSHRVTLEHAAAAARVDAQPVQLTGTVLLQESAGSDRGIAFEIALGAGGALIVLALVFASLLAVLPLIVSAVSIWPPSWPCSGSAR